MRNAITIIGLFVMLFSNPAWSEEKDPDIELDLEVELRIEPTKSAYSPLEPIVVTVSVTNLSDKPQDLTIVLEPCWQFLKVYLIDEGGKQQHISSGVICCGIAGKTTLTTQPPGNSVRQRILLSPKPGCFLQNPGEYGLLATHSAGLPQMLVSKVHTITIKAVADDQTKAFDAYRKSLEMDHKVKKDVLSRKKPVVATFQELEKQFETVAESYPNSVYAPWCIYTLGQKAEHGFISQGIRLKTARSYYERLIKDYGKFPLLADVELRRARLLFRTGDAEEGKREMKRIGQTERAYASELRIYDSKPKLQQQRQ